MRTKWCNNASGGKGQDALRQKVDLLTFIMQRLTKVTVMMMITEINKCHCVGNDDDFVASK